MVHEIEWPIRQRDRLDGTRPLGALGTGAAGASSVPPISWYPPRSLARARECPAQQITSGCSTSISSGSKKRP